MATIDALSVAVTAAFVPLATGSLRARCMISARSTNSNPVQVRFRSGRQIPLAADGVLPLFWQAVNLATIEVAGIGAGVDYVDVVYGIPEIGGLDVGR